MWLIGFFGLICLILSKVFPVANGFSFLAWTPFLIIIYYNQMGSQYCKIKIQSLLIILHALMIAFIAMFFNARGMLLTGAATVSLIFLLNAMRSRKLISFDFIFRFFVFIILGISLSFPASDLVTAMAIARAGRGKESPIKTVKNTLDNFSDKESLDRRRLNSKLQNTYQKYNEFYISNPLLARLITTKFHDNAIYYAAKIPDSSSADILRISGELMLTALPQPFIDFFKLGIRKQDLRFSGGDLVTHYSIGTPLSGYRTGSVFGQGIAIFGWLFTVIYFAICFLLFAAIDLFSKRETTGVITISVIGMLSLWSHFIFGITADSLHPLFIGLVRGIIQPILLYLIAFRIAKFIIKSFSFKATLTHS
jgi:hypothetical protein